MSTNTPPCVELEQVCRVFGESFTLQVPKLTVERGEILFLLGPTGAGKSTLLRILGGLEPAATGNVRFAGAPLETGHSLLPLRRRIASVFQRPLLLTGSVRKNVQYGLELRGKLSAAPDRVDDLIERLGLGQIASQSAQTLSGGQMQLVALARALAVEPELLTLDEPSANLDPAHVALVEEVVAETRTQRGTTVVWATHNLFQARRVADRIALLLDGQVIEEASNPEFFESPSNQQTADFVAGKMIY